MEGKEKQAASAADGRSGLSLDRLDQVLAELPKKVARGPGRPLSNTGPMTMIRSRLDQIETVLAQGVSISMMARELGMKPQALRSYIARARNERAGLTQEGKPRPQRLQAGEYPSPGARTALHRRQEQEPGAVPLRSEPRPAEAPRRLSGPAQGADARPARPAGKPFEFLTGNADEADPQPAQISELPGRQTATQIVSRLEKDIEAARRRGVTWADLARTIGGVTPQVLAQAWSRRHRRKIGTNREEVSTEAQE